MVKNLMKTVFKEIKAHGKYFAAAAAALVLCLTLGGCMNTAGDVMPNTENSTSPQNSVQPNDQNGMQSNNQNGMDSNSGSGMNNGGLMGGTANAPITFDWLQMGTSVEDKINMLSEIEKSRIVVNEGTALVGVQFAGQYQGELTQRIRDMVAGEVMAADASVQTVAVTADAEDVQKINRIADQIASGTPVQDFKQEIDSIVRNVTTLQ